MKGKTIWRAVNSPHGERLVQITLEHARLVRERISGKYTSEIDEEIIDQRIATLRAERDQILEVYEDGEPEE